MARWQEAAGGALWRGQITGPSCAMAGTDGSRSLLWVGPAAVPILVVACGHMLSNALRTLPALAIDMMGRDLATSPETLASLTAA
jgi:hypothetical protein